MEIHIEIQETDALKIKADVLVLKYAQDFFGADSLAFTRLALLHKNLEKKLPKPSEFLLLESLGSLASNYVLFAGVEGLMKFRYKEIREFAFNSLKELAAIKPEAKYICFTMHGANYGLDETEAFEAEIAGFVDALAQGLYPSSLRKISIAEIYEPRAKRLRAVLDKLLPYGIVNVQGGPYLARRSMDTDRLISEAGLNSEQKPLIFVAMPFEQKMDDIFHYGIRNAVNKAGFLCERADEVVFTGDILDLIKRRIGQAKLVIADLTSSNPNVYLEVGYAWGRGIPTVLLAQDAQELKFDVKGQKCIIYSGIRELEEKLSKELLSLR
ncbi:MAG TPA: hypothetical protein VJ821_09845 [Anaerolineales bacterium]|nr:hypothetical protein [Anaerolineales bacterium]